MNDADAMKLYLMIYKLMHKTDWLGHEGPDAGHREDIRQTLTATFPPYVWEISWEDDNFFGTDVYRDDELIGQHTTDEQYNLIRPEE